MDRQTDRQANLPNFNHADEDVYASTASMLGMKSPMNSNHNTCDNQHITQRKNAQPPGGHIFQATGTIFELVQDIIEKNLENSDNSVNNVFYSYITKTATPPWRPCFSTNRKFRTIFEGDQDIIGTNRLTKFHDDRTMNVAKNAPSSGRGGHVFKTTETIFELIQDIIGTNLLTKFHDFWKINVASRVKNAPPPGVHVFQPTGIIFLTHPRYYWDESSDQPLEKKTPPLGSHVYHANVFIFELIQDIIETNLLTKVHEDWK
ncbi:hypothetical protein DPMN_127051 [Dreissena polymorpha]|uniref:Uncharacterized protein n=1 Tax=Dreissena polymorpha TaxID=45954 RepID=A0A9D4H0I7_DREPO|nr:hypothetical protein DPMN_127051 [Dreissena polymorpha]